MYAADVNTVAVNLAGLPGDLAAGGLRRRPAGRPATGGAGLRASRGCWPPATPCSRPATGIAPRPRRTGTDERRDGQRLGSRDRPRSARAAGDAQQAVLGRVHRLRRGAEHPGQRHRCRPARHPAGAQRRGHPDGGAPGPRDRGPHRAPVGVRAQELLLPGPAQGLPDQPVRAADRRRWPSRRDPGRRPRIHGADPARAPGRGCRQVGARRLPRRDRHRPQPRGHAACSRWSPTPAMHSAAEAVA